MMMENIRLPVANCNCYVFFFQPQVSFLSEIIFRYTHLQTEYKYVEQALHENIHHEVFGLKILYPNVPHVTHVPYVPHSGGVHNT